MSGIIELTSPEDRYYSYCLWEYRPVADPEGKFRAATLLFQSFDHAGIDGKAYLIVRKIREAFGISNTVWGTKWTGSEMVWEFYFYDYRRRDRERSVTRLLEALYPLVPSELSVNENLHYFMFSIDIDNRLLAPSGELEKISIYIGNIGSSVSSGISYTQTKQGRQLDNIYFFFDPKRHMDDIAGKICCSAFVEPARVDLDLVLWPELKECNTICLANKRHNDCIYFSGITVDQLIFFLVRMKYPEAVVSFITANREKLDHLLYDVGIDYRVEETGLRIIKSGYYGTF